MNASMRVLFVAALLGLAAGGKPQTDDEMRDYLEGVMEKQEAEVDDLSNREDHLDDRIHKLTTEGRGAASARSLRFRARHHHAKKAAHGKKAKVHAKPGRGEVAMKKALGDTRFLSKGGVRCDLELATRPGPGGAAAAEGTVSVAGGAEKNRARLVGCQKALETAAEATRIRLAEVRLGEVGGRACVCCTTVCAPNGLLLGLA